MHVIYIVLLQTAKVRSFYGGSGHISLGDFEKLCCDGTLLSAS